MPSPTTAITWENTAWAPGVAYPVGRRIVNPPLPGSRANVYQATQGGISDLYGEGPVGDDPDVPETDGTVIWQFLGEWAGSVVDVAPELASLAGADTMLRIAEDMCADVAVWGSRLDDGRRWLAAHLGQLSKLKGRGMVTSESVGPVSRSYAALMGPTVLDLTAAGRMYGFLCRTTGAVFGSVP